MYNLVTILWTIYNFVLDIYSITKFSIESCANIYDTRGQFLGFGIERMYDVKAIIFSPWFKLCVERKTKTKM